MTPEFGPHYHFRFTRLVIAKKLKIRLNSQNRRVPPLRQFGQILIKTNNHVPLRTERKWDQRLDVDGALLAQAIALPADDVVLERNADEIRNRLGEIGTFIFGG